jgi:hypothetical protein
MLVGRVRKDSLAPLDCHKPIIECEVVLGRDVGGDWFVHEGNVPSVLKGMPYVNPCPATRFSFGQTISIL